MTIETFHQADPKDRILRAVGAYVLQAQELEHLLRFLLPMTDENEPSFTGILSRSAKLSKKSLGLMATEFTRAMSGDIAELQQQIAEIIAERNEIVHQFASRFAHLISSNQFEEILTEMRRRHQRVTDLIRVLRPSVLAVLDALRDGPYAGTESYEEFSRLCLTLRSRWAIGEVGN